MLHTKNITKYYQSAKVIEGIELEVRTGELVCLLGKSGVGKTTLFQVLSGLERPEEGDVFLDGEKITGITGKMSYMQQKDLLLPFETIVDNVSAPLTLRGVPRKRAREIAASHCAEFGLSGSEKKYPSQLSGGMRQRAAFLRAYLYSARFMLLDEPFSALDLDTRASLQQWFLKIIRDHGATALLITHDADEALLLADRLYIMSGTPGRITREIRMNGVNRDNPDFLVSSSFISFKKEIRNHL